MMRRTTLTLLGILVTFIAVWAAGPDKLVVQIKNVKNTNGVIRVSLFDSEGNWLKNGQSKESKIAAAGVVVIEFENLKQGTYAVSVIHDENANDKLDTNMMGIPSEPYGFSNDARGMFGPATFEESKFQLTGSKVIQINIK